jgi:hypothetical protein
MKVWITKYALSQGIYEVDAEDCGDGMVADKSARYPQYFHRNGWRPTHHEAVVQANQMRVAKLASIAKQIVKLKTMTFE